MTVLPAGWTEFSIGDLGGTVGGKTPSKSVPHYWSPADIPWVSPKDMKRPVLYGAEDSISERATTEAGMTVLPPGSVLMVTRSGILAHTFPVALTATNVTINQDIKAVRPIREVVPRYLAYALRAYGSHILEGCSKAGTTVASVETELLETFKIPLAPLPEQQRIADKLDDLLARVDACRDRLDRVPAILKRFRQAVLASATSGALTEDWRDNASAAWPVLPLSEVASDFSYGSAAKSATDGRVPVLRMGNIQDGRLDWSDLVFTSDPVEINKYKLSPGDVLFNRTNSPELVGKTAVYKGERPAVYAGYLIRVRCSERLLPDYLNYCLGSPAGRDYCWRVKSDGVSQSNINAKKLAAFEFALPPLDEQAEIVRRVESLFALADAIEARHKTARYLTERLTPSILEKAFRGELVPQDPNDEPGSRLLERIREMKPAATPAIRQTPSSRRSDLKPAAKGNLFDIVNQMPKAIFTFEELRQASSADYESLKEELFTLLADANSGVEQFFDTEAKTMKFRRVFK